MCPFFPNKLLRTYRVQYAVSREATVQYVW
jgi:hypothetical protein